MSQAAMKIGPEAQGQPMSLADFDHAEVQEGFLYELGRGVIVVSDVPGRRHLAQYEATRDQFVVFRVAQPGRIVSIAGGQECKLVIARHESERHPDLAIYLTPPLEEGADLWSTWIPELVIEIVSPGSEIRDYVEKREEYLAFGVKEYWIIDADKETVTVLQRKGGRWQERKLGPADTYRPPVLRGFELQCAPIFEAAKAVAEDK